MATATDINRALKAKYSDDQWRIWFEVSQSTGSMPGRRADAVVMNIWPSKRFQIHVFEVKISRADFKSEMSDPAKWEAVGKYADFFWLACPVGLVRPDEVPEAWGLMELTKARLRVKKQAPARLNPASLDRGFAASLLRSGEDLTQKEIDRRISDGIAAERDAVAEAERKRAHAENSRLKLRLEKAEEWRRQFEEAFGCAPNMHTAPADMAARIALANQLERRMFEPLARQAKGLAEMIEQIRPEAGQT